MSGATNSLANVARKLDPVSKELNITGDNLWQYPLAMGDPIAGLALQKQGKTPFWRMMAKGDPFGNKLDLYGKNAPTPWDPIGRKQGLYGYDMPASQDWGQYQYTAAQMQDPNFNFQNQQRAQASAAAASESENAGGQRKLRGRAGKMLFGE